MKMIETRAVAPRRSAPLIAGALGLAAFAAPPSWAQAPWPTKPVTLLVGFPPGGQTDFAGRVLLAGLLTALGQPVVIDNKAGVNGNLAAADVIKAPADGYRLLVGNGPMTIASHVYTTLVRPLLVTSDKRVPAFPDVPTAAEAGLKDFNIISFIGLYGPPNLPADIVRKANAALNTALKDATVTKGIVDRGNEPGGGTPEQLGTLTRSQHTTWGNVVKANNIRAD